MQNIHGREEEQFSKLFRQEGIERIPERLEILRSFLGTEEHLTSTELMQRLSDAGTPKDPEFVRETLRLLCRYGFAQKRTFNGRRSVYEHRHLGHHHDHMICIKCGVIREFVDDRLERNQAEVAEENGFHMLQHKMEIYGICSDCLGKRMTLVPLSSARAGERARIMELMGGSGVRQRILSMGLRKGDFLEIITNRGSGQVVVAVEGKRYALSRNFARKVLLEPTGREANIGCS